jgi:hypothetical protein
VIKIATTYREDADKIEYKWRVHGVITNDRHTKVTPEELSRKWNIGLQTVKDTLKVTTQKGIHTAIHHGGSGLITYIFIGRDLEPLGIRTRCFRKSNQSVETRARTYTATQGKFTRAIPMTSRQDAGKSLIEFTNDVGIPE